MQCRRVSPKPARTAAEAQSLCRGKHRLALCATCWRLSEKVAYTASYQVFGLLGLHGERNGDRGIRRDKGIKTRNRWKFSGVFVRKSAYWRSWAERAR